MSIQGSEYNPIDQEEKEGGGKKLFFAILVGVVGIAVIVGVAIILQGDSDSGSDDGGDEYVPLDDERPMYLQPGFTVNELALCNDGSPANWHFRDSLPGPNENKWIIRFEGGNCCFDNHTCWNRYEGKDSSFMFPAQTDVIYQDQEGGALHGSPQKNPVFHDYNAIHMHYCSSDAWLGDNGLGEGTNDSPWVFRGYQIVRGIFQELAVQNVSTNAFVDAEEVIISGYSAGGVSVISIADDVRALVKSLAPQAEIKHVSDSGWFLITADELCGENMDCLTYNNCPLLEQYRRGYEFWGTQKTLDPDCLAAGYESNCTAPQFSYPFLDLETQQNLLLMESQYDQMNHDLHVGDDCEYDEYSQEWDDYWTYLHGEIVSTILDAGVLNYECTTCSNHDALPKDWLYTITFMTDNASHADVIVDFLAGESIQRMEDECDYMDCNPTCPVHTPPLHID